MAKVASKKAAAPAKAALKKQQKAQVAAKAKQSVKKVGQPSRMLLRMFAALLTVAVRSRNLNVCCLDVLLVLFRHHLGVVVG